jgi:hypothetical protein
MVRNLGSSGFFGLDGVKRVRRQRAWLVRRVRFGSEADISAPTADVPLVPITE